MSWAIWITGPPGSGKSVIAREVEAELRAVGQPVIRLELDEIRKSVTPDPRYTDRERDIVYRALGYMAALLVETGTPVLIDATAHRRIWRDLVREAVPHFAEVQLVCPLAICQERERERAPGHAPRNIYRQAGRPGATVPGVDVAYEAALAPELLIDTSVQTRRENPWSASCGWPAGSPTRAAEPPLRSRRDRRAGLGDLDHRAGRGVARARSPRGWRRRSASEESASACWTWARCSASCWTASRATKPSRTSSTARSPTPPSC